MPGKQRGAAAHDGRQLHIFFQLQQPAMYLPGELRVHRASAARAAVRDLR